MLSKNGLFTKTFGNVPPTWTFYIMPSLHESGLSAQDIVHLLAKMRNRLLTPSNLLTMGSKVACRAHSFHVLITFNKLKHGLTQQAINNKDKQNYSSIALLVEQKVEACLQESMLVMKTKGIIVYSSLMRNIRDCFFNKSLSPVERLYLIWKTIFFLRIWRTWLNVNNYNENDHFVTPNAHICMELNGHLLLNTVVRYFPNGNIAGMAYRISILRANF